MTRQPRDVRATAPTTPAEPPPEVSRWAARSAGVEDPEPIGCRRISVDDLDRRPSPLPDADARGAGEPDSPTGAFDVYLWPGFGGARPVRTMGAQHIGENEDRVVALEGDEGRRLGQPLAEDR